MLSKLFLVIKKASFALKNIGLISRTTSHYPCNPKLFPKNPRTYGKELPTIKIIDKPNVTELGLKLAGF